MFNRVKFEQLKIKTKKNLKKITEIADILPHIGKSKFLSFASVGAKLTNSFIENTHSNYHIIFSNFGLEEINVKNNGFISYILRTLMADYKPVFYEEQNRFEVCYFENIDGFNYGFIINNERNSWGQKEYLYASSSDELLIKRNIGKILWKHLSSNNVEISSQDSTNIFGEDKFNINVLPANPGFPSQKTDLLFDKIHKFINKGKNRTVMLEGRPGTGKTQAINRIIDRSNFFTIRFNPKTLSKYTFDLKEILLILSPDAIVIDDFDRIMNPEGLLSELEFMKETVKLVIVSVNDTSNFHEAVFRPGRFDIIEEFNDIDGKIKTNLIGDIDEFNKQRLLLLPIAYINEFNERKQVLGVQEAINSIDELERRVNRVNNLDKKKEK